MRSKMKVCTLAITPLAAPACGLLDVTDPTVVMESDVANAEGPNCCVATRSPTCTTPLRTARARAGSSATSSSTSPPSSVITGGTISTRCSWTSVTVTCSSSRWTTSNGQPYAAYEKARMSLTHALDWYSKYGTQAQQLDVGQLLAARGYIVVSQAEQICAGFALHDLEDGRPRYKNPLTTEEAFEHALVDLDMAVVATAEDEELHSLAQVLRARTLLGLGRFAEAAEAAAEVPTDFLYQGEYGPARAS